MDKDQTQIKILTDLESISKEYPNKLLRLNGLFKEDYFELLVFKGFSSCTTHPTELDLNHSSLPKEAILNNAQLLNAPIEIEKEIILRESSRISFFLKKENWE